MDREHALDLLRGLLFALFLLACYGFVGTLEYENLHPRQGPVMEVTIP